LKNPYFLAFFFGAVNGFGQTETITHYTDPQANGTLFLQVRNDTAKYICNSIEVKNGKTILCDSNQFVDYKYYIHRNRIDSNWLNNVMRVYDTWMKIPKYGLKGTWLNYEKSGSVYYRETFTAKNQKTGISYKHHETRKNLIGYILANPKSKSYEDEEKYQFQYDWEENIRGRYEVYFFTGIKKFKHSYEINRIMTMDKGLFLPKKYSIDAQISGTISEYHPNGKKKLVVTYSDRIIKDNLSDDNVERIKSSNHSGDRVAYNENGKLFSKGRFTSKGMNGRVEYFGPKGLIVVKVEHYKEGVLDGKYVEYYLDGKVKAKGEYKNGVLVGEIEYFNEDGTPLKG
tara:strand:+ start:9462 stop:10490 length:1029 start_codon:yes stop_codon:yes gene_type:complete